MVTVNTSPLAAAPRGFDCPAAPSNRRPSWTASGGSPRSSNTVQHNKPRDTPLRHESGTHGTVGDADRDTSRTTEAPSSHTTLVCLGFAGSGASFFRPWQDLAPTGLRVVAPQLPGREWRIDEPPPLDVREAVDSILDTVVSSAEGTRVALFGQCFGAILAFELAHELVQVPEVDLVHLFPSGSPGPWTRKEPWATGLDDEHLLRRVRDDAGYQHEALEIPELRDLIVPALRADMESHEKYTVDTSAPLDVPVTAIRGRDDRIASATAAREWAAATTAPFALAEFDGGHMYIVDLARSLLELVESVTRPS